MNLAAVGVHEFYTFLLVGARVGGLLTAAPLLGNRAIPKSVKAGLALLVSLMVTPAAAQTTGPVPEHLLLLAGGVLKDALFGLTLGYMARVLFASVEMAGYWIDTQMGFGFVNLVNPFSEQQGSVLSVFYYQMAMTVYLLANGHLLLLGAVLHSFTLVAPGAVVLKAGLGLTLIPLLKMMLALGAQIALPAVGVLLVADVAFGLIARAVPQINVFIVGAPAKIVLGLATTAVVLPLLASGVGQIIAGVSVGLQAITK